MSELSCAQCRRLAAELAFNIVTGRERAAALAHLDRCGHCRRRVAELAQTADQLIELLPEVEPPAGFTHRTATALIPRAPRRRRVSPPISAILLAVALTAGGLAVSASRSASVPAPDDTRAGDRVVLYAPLTFHRHLVGQAYLYPGTPSWIYVSVEDATGADRLACEVVRPDGSTVAVGTVALREGHGAWGGPTSVDPEGLTGTRLVSPRGRTVASGQFSSHTGNAPTERVSGIAPVRPGSVDPSDAQQRTNVADRRDAEGDEPGRDHDHHRHRGHDHHRHGEDRDRHGDDGDRHGEDRDQHGDDGDRHGDGHGGHKGTHRMTPTDQHRRSASRAGGHGSHHSKPSHRGGPGRDLLSLER